MPSLVIPESGLFLEGPPGLSSKSGSAGPMAFGLTLTNGMIEDMIKCVQNGKPIQLSLGAQPSLSFGNKTQHLATFDDPFTQELYSTNPEASSTMLPAFKRLNKDPARKPNLQFLSAFGGKGFKLAKKGPSSTAKPAAPSSNPVSGEDLALQTLRNSLQSETEKKKGNTTKLIDPPTRINGQPKKSKGRLLGQSSRFNDTTRSLPASPVTNGLNSPMQGPTSVPPSQQQAEQSKAARKPVVHLLAYQPMSESDLQDKLPDISLQDLQHALHKVADEDSRTHKFELKRNFYKELDVWAYDYESSDIRQKVIDTAIKVYDKMRLSQSEPEWDRLKPKSQRGDGVSLSKIQAKIAQGPIPRTPKVHVEKADSGRDTGDEEPQGDKSKVKTKSEAIARSTSQPPATKSKKVSEKEAQSKRLLSNPTKKAAPKATAKKETARAAARPLSSQFVTESDDEDVYAKDKPSTKRGREDEATSSDSSIPLSKKVKKEAPAHRISDASQSSRNTTSTYSSYAVKTKGTSPQKSSPLASSPPTNASEFDDSSASSSSTPAHASVKHSRSPIHKRHQKSSSVTSSGSASSSYSNLKPHIIELAVKYRVFYPKYAALHRELSADAENRDQTKEEQLLDMHARLLKMKNEIKEATAASLMEG